LYNSRALPLTANDRKMNSPVEMRRVKCFRMTCNNCNLMLNNFNRRLESEKKNPMGKLTNFWNPASWLNLNSATA